MNLGPEEIVWLFDGRQEMRELLAGLVEGFISQLKQLEPPSVSRGLVDPFEALLADQGFSALHRITGPQLERLFPRPVAEEFDAGDSSWEAMVRSRAQAMRHSAEAVLARLSIGGDLIAVRQGEVAYWLQTLGALRAALHAALSGSSDPAAQPTASQIENHPWLDAVTDWLAYQLEDLLQTRSACLAAGVGLDQPEENHQE